MTDTKYRRLTPVEVHRLKNQNCLAEDWGSVLVAGEFDERRIYGVEFHGTVKIGELTGTVRDVGGIEKHAGIFRAKLSNCEIGDNVLICEVVGHIANYRIGPGAIIEGVGSMATMPGATFGNGTIVEAVNEGGGREIPIFETLSSQFAYMMSAHRYRPKLIEGMQRMVAEFVKERTSDIGEVGAGAVVRSVPEIKDVRIGPAARIVGASLLERGTVLSEPGDPAEVGSGVVARDFVIGEGSRVFGGAMLSRCFVGQGVRIGKQFSAENSLFFANAEAFHGEACSIFAGPYTTTHHKSTLLIAGMFSFYNAGSGSNQSNHMYKLGPLHQGLLERGAKTGSFSYMIWPCVVGPFSVVIGKHSGNFDLSDMPFSYIDAAANGRSYVVPGMNLFTVGTVRDGAKWPARDRRKASRKRDRIVFDVFGPYTVGRMIEGEKRLKTLVEETDRSVDEIKLSGAMIRRLVMKTAARYYATGIDMYLRGKVFERAEGALSDGAEAMRCALGPKDGAVYSAGWVDISGLLLARDRLESIEQRVETGQITDLSALSSALDDAYRACDVDEWEWIRRAYAARYGKSPEALSGAELAATAEEYAKVRTKFLKMVLTDAQKEFDELAKIGFGVDGAEGDREADFAAVRGTFEDDKFVEQIRSETEDVRARVAQFSEAVRGSQTNDS
jgi:hypothetical protein